MNGSSNSSLNPRLGPNNGSSTPSNATISHAFARKMLSPIPESPLPQPAERQSEDEANNNVTDSGLSSPGMSPKDASLHTAAHGNSHDINPASLTAPSTVTAVHNAGVVHRGDHGFVENSSYCDGQIHNSSKDSKRTPSNGNLDSFVKKMRMAQQTLSAALSSVQAQAATMAAARADIGVGAGATDASAGLHGHVFSNRGSMSSLRSPPRAPLASLNPPSSTIGSVPHSYEGEQMYNNANASAGANVGAATFQQMRSAPNSSRNSVISNLVAVQQNGLSSSDPGGLNAINSRRGSRDPRMAAELEAMRKVNARLMNVSYIYIYIYI